LDPQAPKKAYDGFIETVRLLRYINDGVVPDIDSILKLPYPIYADTLKMFADDKKHELERLQQQRGQIEKRFKQ